MFIQINPGDVELSQAISDHAETEIRRALQHVAARITRVEVHLRDDNSSKSGPRDKRCTMEARPAGQQPLVVEDRGEDLYAVITGAAGKLERALRRHFEKLDTRR